MKRVLLALMFFAVLQVVFVSCRDTKKEIETEETTSAVQKQIEDTSKKAVKEAKEIEVAAKETVGKTEEKIDRSLGKEIKEETKEATIDTKQKS